MASWILDNDDENAPTACRGKVLEISPLVLEMDDGKILHLSLDCDEMNVGQRVSFMRGEKN